MSVVDIELWIGAVVRNSCGWLLACDTVVGVFCHYIIVN